MLLLLLLSLNIIITNEIIIVEPGGPRRVVFVWVLQAFSKKSALNASKTISSQNWPFVVVASFLSFSSKDSHEFPLKHNVFSSFFKKLSFSCKDFH